jgi:ElaB/YqjD/DUF883 family membrane-anchored ribosome-binding protein
MATAIGATRAAETVKERLIPAIDRLDETIRQGRRVIVRGQHAAEDAAAAAALSIRRRPGAAVLIAVGVGAVLGALVGFRLGWVIHKESVRS